MARQHGLEAVSQRGEVELAVGLQRDRHVVEGAVGGELVKEPEALLGVGERQRAGALDWRKRQRRRRATLYVRNADRQRRDRGRLEERAQGQFDREEGADARDEPGGEQRVP